MSRPPPSDSFQGSQEEKGLFRIGGGVIMNQASTVLAGFKVDPDFLVPHGIAVSHRWRSRTGNPPLMAFRFRSGRPVGLVQSKERRGKATHLSSRN